MLDRFGGHLLLVTSFSLFAWTTFHFAALLFHPHALVDLAHVTLNLRLTAFFQDVFPPLPVWMPVRLQSVVLLPFHALRVNKPFA